MEAEELSNSVLLEISKSSVVRWQEKLKSKYGWFKTEKCKNIIFEVSRTGQSPESFVLRDKSFLKPFTCPQLMTPRMSKLFNTYNFLLSRGRSQPGVHFFLYLGGKLYLNI